MFRCERMSDTSIENIMEAVTQSHTLEEFHLILEGYFKVISLVIFLSCMNISSIGLYSVIEGLKYLTRLSLLELTLSG